MLKVNFSQNLPLNTKLKLNIHLEMLKVNFLQNLPVCFISVGQFIYSGIQPPRYVILRMLSCYSSCNTNTIQKSFDDLINIRAAVH